MCVYAEIYLKDLKDEIVDRLNVARLSEVNDDPLPFPMYTLMSLHLDPEKGRAC